MRTQRFALALLTCVIGLGDRVAQAEMPATSAGSESRLKPEISRAARKATEQGTRWLLSAVRVDGSVGPDLKERPDLGSTSIVGLALLAQGNTPKAGPHFQTLRKVMDAVLNMVERLPYKDDPERPYILIRRKIGHNADLFLAALFLSQVLGESAESEKEVKASLEKLVAIIGRAQGSDGTWGDKSWAPILGTVLGWECLRASSSCGLKVNASATAAGEALLKKLQKQTADTDDWMHDFYKYASSVRVLYSLGYVDDPVFQKCVKRILKIAHDDHRPFGMAGGEEYLAFFLVTECLLQGSEVSWQDWYPLISDKIVYNQNGDGSWTGHHCIKDRTFCTACAILTLQAPNLCMPMSNM